MMPLKSFYVLQSRLKCSTWNSICWKDICKYNDRSPTYIKQLIHLISFENIFTRTNQAIHEIKFLFKLKDICRLFFLGSSLSREIFIQLAVFCSFKHYGHFTIWRWCFAFFLTHIVSESLCFLKKCRKYGRKVLRPLKSDQYRLEGTSKQFLKFGCKWWRCLDCKQLLPINLKAFQVLKILTDLLEIERIKDVKVLVLFR